MIEGLWVLKFLNPSDSHMDLNGGVVVFETGRILGGDSGYAYIGRYASHTSGSWKIDATILRHDPEMTSIFGDLDKFILSGNLARLSDDTDNILTGEMFESSTGKTTRLSLRKIAELP